MNITKILSGHTSPETAFVVEDYPYGFRLRCKIRYWLETNNKGTRFCSQTTNPKREGEVWNKPKYSTYSEISGAMYLDENGHTQWASINQFSDEKKCQEFLDTFGESATNFDGLKKWTRRKVIYEEEMNKFTPRPDYGSALFRSAYLSSVARFGLEGV
jgi:hypothetical protein